VACYGRYSCSAILRARDFRGLMKIVCLTCLLYHIAMTFRMLTGNITIFVVRQYRPTTVMFGVSKYRPSGLLT